MLAMDLEVVLGLGAGLLAHFGEGLRAAQLPVLVAVGSASCLRLLFKCCFGCLRNDQRESVPLLPWECRCDLNAAQRVPMPPEAALSWSTCC